MTIVLYLVLWQILCGIGIPDKCWKLCILWTFLTYCQKMATRWNSDAHIQEMAAGLCQFMRCLRNSLAYWHQYFHLFPYKHPYINPYGPFGHMAHISLLYLYIVFASIDTRLPSNCLFAKKLQHFNSKAGTICTEQ